jgi:hypothetical protein
MLCNCKSCLHYKSISEIINKTELNVIDPATFIREKINCNFEITKEECDILERMKQTNDYTEYKQYLLNPSHYNKNNTHSVIKCPSCYEPISIIISTIKDQTSDYICCSNLLNNNIHDVRCMNYK